MFSDYQVIVKSRIAYLKFFGEVICYECCEWWKQRGEKYTDIPDIDGDVEEIHHMIQYSWCNHQTYKNIKNID